jgi:hypothetical protein
MTDDEYPLVSPTMAPGHDELGYLRHVELLWYLS